jgi:hypothetical protein
MTDQKTADKPAPSPERWIYGGLRLLDDKKVHAWLPELTQGQPLGGELLYQHKGSWVVGGVYQAMVSRFEKLVRLHGSPGPWQQRLDDAATVGRLELLDRQSRDALALIALERKAAKDPALAKAMQPLLEIAATLVTDSQIRALTAYVTEQVYVARFRRR